MRFTRRLIAATLIARAGRPWPVWLCVGSGYLALTVVFFWPSLWYGMLPLPLLNPYVQPDPIWASAPAPDSSAGANLLLGDVSGFYYPYLTVTLAALHVGEFPLWIRGLFGGIPYFASNQAAIFYPINLLCYGLGPVYFWVVAAVLRLLLAGVGTYLLVRRLGAGPLGAMLSGGIYMFAAYNVVWLQFAIHNVSALLPLALWLTLRLCEAPGRWDGLALAGVIAAQLFGGHPETSVAFMLIWSSFAAFWLPWRGAWRRPAAALAIAGALGVAIATVQWLPTLALVRSSMTLAQRAATAQIGDGGGTYAPVGGLHTVQWGNLRYWLLLIAPEMWGSPRGQAIRNWMPVRTNYNEMASYVGLVTLPLAVGGALQARPRRARIFFRLLFVLSLGLLYPLPGLYRLGYLPVFQVAPGIRFGLGVTLGAAVLAGLGLEWVCVAGRRTQAGVAVALGVLVGLNLAIVADLWGGQRVRWVLGFVPDAHTRALIAAVYQSGNWRLGLPTAAGSLAAIIFGALACGWLSARRAGALIVGCVLGELLLAGFGFNGFTSASAVYPVTSVTAWLRQDPTPGRVLNLDGTLWANTALTQRLEVPAGMEDLVPHWQQRFVDRGLNAIVRDADRQVVMDWGRRFIDLMNVRYIVATRAVTAGPRGPAYPLAFVHGNVRVYRNPTALPRAYAARSVVLTTTRDAEDTVYAARFDPWRTVALEEPPTPPLPAGPNAASVAPVAIISATTNRIELAPELPDPAVVVLAESFDSDWRVTVDGEPARLLRANGMFRGVAVPAGKHRVVFSYWPRPVIEGALVSGLALLGALAIALWPRGASERLI
jgi:hypothetical protein